MIFTVARALERGLRGMARNQCCERGRVVHRRCSRESYCLAACRLQFVFKHPDVPPSTSPASCRQAAGEAYDVTFCEQPGGYQQINVMGQVPEQAEDLPLSERLSGSPKNIWIRERNQRSPGSLSCDPRQAMCSSKVRDSTGRSSARTPPAAVSTAAA